MKTHTYFLSGRALAILASAVTGMGALIFVLGLFVGMMLMPAPHAVAGTAVQQTVASAGGAAGPAGDSVAAPSDAAWPFSAAPGADAAPVDSVPRGVAPDSARVRRDTVLGHRAAFISAVYDGTAAPAPAAVAPLAPLAPQAPDTARYLVQVGMFRLASNAQALVQRLAAAGIEASVRVRDDDGRALRIVRVGGYVGRQAAERAARRIGDAEGVVAQVLVAAAAR
jgi:cell division septation protein DedD